MGPFAGVRGCPRVSAPPSSWFTVVPVGESSERPPTVMPTSGGMLGL
jgi:hypothetical protein